MKMLIRYSLFFAAGFLVHLFFTKVIFTPPFEFEPQYDFNLSSSFYNSQNGVCNFLSERNCGCNIVIETQRMCKAELQNYLVDKMREEARKNGHDSEQD